MPRIHVNRFLTQLIRPALAALPDDPKPIMQTKDIADIEDYLEGGYVYARKITGSGMDPKFAEFADIQVDVYALDDDTAEAVANVVDQAIYDAWWNQTVFDEGHIANYESTVTPFDFPDPQMPDDTCRYTAEYRLLLRPAA